MVDIHQLFCGFSFAPLSLNYCSGLFVLIDFGVARILRGQAELVGLFVLTDFGVARILRGQAEQAELVVPSFAVETCFYCLSGI